MGKGHTRFLPRHTVSEAGSLILLGQLLPSGASALLEPWSYKPPPKKGCSFADDRRVYTVQRKAGQRLREICE